MRAFGVRRSAVPKGAKRAAVWGGLYARRIGKLRRGDPAFAMVLCPEAESAWGFSPAF
jgi:hypothetical protein